MGKITVSRQPPPQLGNGIYYKDIPYRSRREFAEEIVNWIAGFVSRSRATHLVVSASGFEDIMRHIEHAPTTMAVPGAGAARVWRVHVEFFWGRTPDRQWWVRGIGLHIKDSMNNIMVADKRAERERLEDEYERRNLKAAPSARKLWFEVEKYSADFDHDLINGKQIVQILIDKVYEVAKEVAKMPVNPIGPDPNDPMSILTETFKAGVGATIGALKELGVTARHGFEVAHQGAELGDKVYGRFKDGDAIKGVVDLIEIGLSLSSVAGPFAPMVSAIIGSFIEIGIANMAGPVTRVRSHMYVCYVGGVLNEIIHQTAIKPTRPGDEVMFKFGAKQAARIGPAQRYNLQLALMTYAFKNPVGEWNLNAMNPNPTFPDDYLRYWSPAMLERSLLVQLCKAKYLYK